MGIKALFKPNILMSIAVILALFSGYAHDPTIYSLATTVSEIFINLLKLVSVPIIFLSIVATVSGMDNVDEFKSLGKRVIKYTLFTTTVAAAIALTLFLVINPVRSQMVIPDIAVEDVTQKGYIAYLLKVIPSNFLQPFVESHVISVLFLAILLSLSILALPENNRKILHSFFQALYAAVMKITTWIVRWIPLGIWSFITLFIKDVRNGLDIESLALYLLCVVAANLVQGLVVLPTLLKVKGISPIRVFKGMLPALSLAFFSKSSGATLPLAMRCAEENVGIPKKIAGFALPLCTTINMNACAAFILTTVLFVSMSHGMTYSYLELVSWIFIATLAALGNAGVPMGCYFLTSAFLVAMNVPLNILGVILPFYTLIDMLETAINVWSDSCVVSIVADEVTEKSKESMVTA